MTDPRPDPKTDLPRHAVRIADLPTRAPSSFDLVADAAGLSAIAAALDVVEVRKFRFAGRLSPAGERDWRLEATIGATAIQTCVVTLDPVTTRIDEPVERTYLADYQDPEEDEVELTEDTVDPLPATLDLYQVGIEALALALPAYPRKDGVQTGEDGKLAVTEPGKRAMTDADARPFAGLAALRDSLGAKRDDGD